MQSNDNMSKIILQLVTYNAEKYVPLFFKSLNNQTFKNWQLCILDNGSTDGTVEIIQKEIKKIENAELIISQENKGFSGGHNFLFKKSNSEYVALLSIDMYLKEDCLEQLIVFLDNEKEVGSATPRLMRWNFSLLEEHNFDPIYLVQSFSNDIDSLGLKVFKNRRVVEWYQGEKWEKIKHIFLNKTVEVFGASGALPIFRRTVLDLIKSPEGNIFNEIFESYKEDVDLAFRLRSRGQKVKIVLDAVAYHDRTAAGTKSLGDISATFNKIKQSSTVKYYSYRNHLMMLYKNEYWQNFLLDFPLIWWYEFKKFTYFLLFDRVVLKGLKDIYKNRKKLKESRIRNKSLKKINWKEMRKWWV